MRRSFAIAVSRKSVGKVWRSSGQPPKGASGVKTYVVNFWDRTLRSAPYLLAQHFSFSGNSVPGMSGDVRFAAIDAEQHRWLHNRLAQELNRPKPDTAAKPAGKPLMWLGAT